MNRIAERFTQLLETYRRPDGGRWGGQHLEDATGGVVSRSYVSTLKKGGIDSPGYDKLRAIAKAMGFPPEVWFDASTGRSAIDGAAPPEDGTFGERLERLFEVLVNEREKRAYTNAEVARMSLGGVTEEEVASLRSGRTENPRLGQVLALAEAFGVSPSYFLEERAPVLSREAVEALSDAASTEIIHKTLTLSKGEKKLILDLLSHLGHVNDGR